MTGTYHEIVPAEVARHVEAWLDEQFDRVQRYENAELLDQFSVFALNTLIAKVYAAGWEHGATISYLRTDAERRRAKNRAARDAKEGGAK